MSPSMSKIYCLRNFYLPLTIIYNRTHSKLNNFLKKKFFIEVLTGFEPVSPDYETGILPLYYKTDSWCPRGDLNPHVFRHLVLRQARLPNFATWTCGWSYHQNHSANSLTVTYTYDYVPRRALRISRLEVRGWYAKYPYLWTVYRVFLMLNISQLLTGTSLGFFVARTGIEPATQGLSPPHHH